MFFFFKQKTAYGMRISDWSSYVCSSDLHRPDDHMRRAAIGEAVEDVADHRAGRRGDDADRARQIGQRLFALAVEQPLAAEPRFQFLEEQHQRAFARDLEAVDDELIFRPSRKGGDPAGRDHLRSEEHTSELKSLMRISYAVFCLKKNRLR